MINRAVIFYIGCSLIPSPPSPCMDFGLQFVAVLIIGLISPVFLIKPINSFMFKLADIYRKIFSKVPGLRIVVEKTCEIYNKWENIMKRKREPKNRFVAGVFRFIVKKDFIQRIIFGYIVTVAIGIVLMTLALL